MHLLAIFGLGVLIGSCGVGLFYGWFDAEPRRGGMIDTEELAWHVRARREALRRKAALRSRERRMPW